MTRRTGIFLVVAAGAAFALLAAAAALDWGFVLVGGVEIASRKGFLGLFSVSGPPIQRPIAFFDGITQWEWHWLPVAEWSRTQRGVLIPAWYPPAVTLLLFTAALVRHRARAKSLCETCGYSRLGLESPHPCPECGTIPRRTQS